MNYQQLHLLWPLLTLAQVLAKLLSHWEVYAGPNPLSKIYASQIWLQKSALGSKTTARVKTFLHDVLHPPPKKKTKTIPLFRSLICWFIDFVNIILLIQIINELVNGGENGCVLCLTCGSSISPQDIVLDSSDTVPQGYFHCYCSPVKPEWGSCIIVSCCYDSFVQWEQRCYSVLAQSSSVSKASPGA